jgi:hypothetical protein
MATESQLSFEKAACQVVSLGTEELNWGTEASALLSSSVEWKVRLCKEDFMCAVVTVRLLYIRCQDTTGEDSRLEKA